MLLLFQGAKIAIGDGILAILSFLCQHIFLDWLDIYRYGAAVNRSGWHDCILSSQRPQTAESGTFKEMTGYKG